MGRTLTESFYDNSMDSQLEQKLKRFIADIFWREYQIEDSKAARAQELAEGELLQKSGSDVRGALNQLDSQRFEELEKKYSKEMSKVYKAFKKIIIKELNEAKEAKAFLERNK